MVDVRHTWGQAIRNQRELQGLTQQELADKVGVRQAAVSQWESGHVAPSVTHQVAIAQALRVDGRILFPHPTPTTEEARS